MNAAKEINLSDVARFLFKSPATGNLSLEAILERVKWYSHMGFLFVITSGERICDVVAIRLVSDIKMGLRPYNFFKSGKLAWVDFIHGENLFLLGYLVTRHFPSIDKYAGIAIKRGGRIRVISRKKSERFFAKQNKEKTTKKLEE